MKGVSKVTLRFWAVTTSVVGANSPLFGGFVEHRIEQGFEQHFSYVVERLRVRKSLVLPVDALGFELRRSTVRRFSINCRVTVSFIYEVAYLTGMVSFGISRLICVSFGIMRQICASFGITRLIYVSFGIMRLIRASFGITRLICASFGITRLICASDEITRLIEVRVWREANRQGTRRMREGHMDASSFFTLPLTY
ncbi:hypothetical protein E6C27_scaffold270G00540 [Cucumis melo var. makuwa]|uniref:Mucin-19-like n=1 Tax=Cucumis melo var. makuwa TaxID=1194695 RepID=A0A5A7T7M4_CUCMM|nr:hypothetical protein E6C27_scaffold270G00540 [Cucumis melo var. makuwa]